MDKKLFVSILVILIIPFVLFFAFYNFFPDNASPIQPFYSRTFDSNEKIIFLIGSSEVGNMNTTLIDEDVSNRYPNHVVYNLAYTSDTPDRRIQNIEKIISLKPEIIFYGVSYRDFESSIDQNNYFADPQQLDRIIFKDYLNIEQYSPIDSTIRAIQILIINLHLYPKSSFTLLPHEPFYTFINPPEPMYSNTELANQEKGLIQHIIKPTPNNQHVEYFEKIIKEIQKNHIKVIVFTNPESRYYLSFLPDSEKTTFNSIIQNVSKKFNVKIYNFTERYADMPIWVNWHHVAYNTKSMIYSKDITNMIISEIGS